MSRQPAHGQVLQEHCTAKVPATHRYREDKGQEAELFLFEPMTAESLQGNGTSLIQKLESLSRSR